MFVRLLGNQEKYKHRPILVAATLIFLSSLKTARMLIKLVHLMIVSCTKQENTILKYISMLSLSAREIKPTSQQKSLKEGTIIASFSIRWSGMTVKRPLGALLTFFPAWISWNSLRWRTNKFYYSMFQYFFYHYTINFPLYLF